VICLYPMKLLLTALIAAACLSLVGCSKLQSYNELPGPDNSSSSPTAAEITDGMDEQVPDLLPPGQEASESKIMLPFVFNQSVLPAAGDNTVDINCTDTNPHPIGQSIAGTYSLSYQQVMTWFCSGYSFENILVALETSEAVDLPVDMLLQMLLEKEWEEIWDEIGFLDNR
jgi:hypothetical protein